MNNGIHSLGPVLVAMSVCGAFAAPGPDRVRSASADEVAVAVGQPRALIASPATVEIRDRRDARQLLITGRYADGSVRDLTHRSRIVAEQPSIVSVEPGGYLRPRQEGRTVLIVSAGGQELRVPVVVRGQGQPALLSFRRDVVAVLNVSGCNAGACHGAPSGKNGFKLSLRGFDPAADYAQLTRDQSGRRVNRAEPESSLFLMKGQGLIPHEGGQKLAPRGELAALLRDWVVEGVRDDPADVPAVSSIEIRPGPRIITAPARQQQLAVIAHFADGSDRDVTRLTAFSSSDEEVAKVNSKGLVEFNRTGEAAVLCRYLETLLPVRLAFIDPDSSQPWPNPPAYNVVDRHLFAKMKQLGLAPADLSSDSEFIRRASLDLCGILPTPQEVRSFLADQRSEKRPRLIDHLLERPEYVDYWTLKWADVLGNNRRSLQAKGAYAFHQWLRDHVARNSPVDVMVRQIVSASGSTFLNPPTNFFRNDRVAKDAEDLAQNTAQLFMGVRISCAHCHNHPFEKWTQQDYYGLAAFFVRVNSSQDSLNPRIARFNTGALVISDDQSGEAIHPRTGKIIAAKFPGGARPVIQPGTSRRTVLASWLTSNENSYFARSVANRIWYHLMGRGIVEPVDDVRDSNPPASEELLDALAKDLTTHNYDAKHLIRLVMTSRVYQLASGDPGPIGEKYFTHAVVRLLPAEPLLDALSAATDVPETFGEADRRNADVGQKVVDPNEAPPTFGAMPVGTRATQLPDGDVYQHPFLSAFGQPARETSCECERTSDAGLVHALQLINGPSVKDKLTRRDNRIGKLLAADRPDTELLDELYLATVARFPTDQERTAALLFLAKTRPSGRRQAWEDVQWALLNSKEFLFRH
jgi:Protein of unknown function (DUF1553)/Protein of unknown function (DUF1549)/Bacterial Ig-like domain (group 2)